MKNRVEKYIKIVEIGSSPTGKTKIWNVENVYHGHLCGQVRWYGGFRKYCFFAADIALYDSDFMRMIAEFLELQNNTRGLFQVDHVKRGGKKVVGSFSAENLEAGKKMLRTLTNEFGKPFNQKYP